MRRPLTSSVGQSLPIRSFAITAAAVLFFFTVAVFVGLYLRISTVVERSVAEQATSYVDLIVDARAWNAAHGGVWVLKTPASPTNPYLRMLGVEPDTSTVSGTQLTLRNPAAMTNEISKIAAANDQVTFRMTSLLPINPADAPDSWERQQLERFQTDRSEVTRIELQGNTRVLRLMRPLITEASCLQCHARQGYKVGDVRGAISVAVPLAPTEASLERTAWSLGGIFILVLVVGGTIGYQLLQRLIKRLDESEELLRVAATTDELTGVANRRAVFERLDSELARLKRTGSTLGVIIVDIDRFKRVNDGHGHAAGDAVLRELSTRLNDGLRDYDLLGRIGGEEFLIVAPEIDIESLMRLTERLRLSVAEEPVRYLDLTISVRVSAGITVARADDTPDTLMSRADVALYQAKADGRNRTEAG